MFNKNDPLISAVQEVMKRNHAEREAAKVVNEKFGVYDRKALPHEKQGEWDAAFKSVLTEGVEALDEKINMTQQQMANLDGNPKFTGKDLAHLRAGTHKKKAAAGELEEKKMTDAEMAKREEIVKSMKKGASGFKKRYGKRAKDVMYATATKQAMKEDNEGFNNRHSLSVTASADKKQTVAVLNEEDIDSYENRMTAGLGQPYVPYGARPGAGGAKTGTLARMPVRIDPGLRNINTRTGEQIKTSSGPKTRKRVVSKKKPPQQQGPAKPPSGTFLDNLARGRRNVGMDKTKPAANLAAGAARRPPGTSTVPQIRQTGPSTGSNLPQGPWGGINRRGGARNPISSTLTAGGARRPAGQSAPPIGQQGPKLPPPKSSSGIIRRGGAALAAGAALDLATSSTPVGNQPPAAAAATRTGPSFEKTGRGNAPSVSDTGTKAQTDLKPANVMSAKPSFEFSDKQREAAKAGKASIKDVQSWAQSRGIKANPGSKEILRNYLNAAQNKTMKTNVKAGGTAATPTQTAAQSAEMKFKAGMAQRSGPSVPVKPPASPSPAPNVQPARNSTLAAPSATAATTMATATKAAGQMAVDRMKAQNIDAAKKPAASVTPQMSQDISSLKTDSLPYSGNKRSFVPRFAERELTRRQNIQTVKGA